MFDKYSLILAAIPWVIMLTLWFGQLIYSLYCWVNDESTRKVFCPGLCRWIMKKHKPHWSQDKEKFGGEPRYWLMSYNNNRSADGFIWQTAFYGSIFSILLLMWQAGLPVIFIILSLFGIRIFIRFKKKVNKALERFNPVERTEEN